MVHQHEDQNNAMDFLNQVLQAQKFSWWFQSDPFLSSLLIDLDLCCTCYKELQVSMEVS